MIPNMNGIIQACLISKSFNEKKFKQYFLNGRMLSVSVFGSICFELIEPSKAYIADIKDFIKTHWALIIVSAIIMNWKRSQTILVWSCNPEQDALVTLWPKQ